MTAVSKRPREAKPTPDEVLFYSVEFRVGAPLEHAEESEYVTEINGVIHQHGELPSGAPAPPVEVGSIKAYRVYGGRALNDGASLWDECDAHSQTAADLYGLVFSEGYEFADAIQEMFPDAMSPEVLLIDLVRLVPTARGRGVGLRAARRVMDLFEPDGGVVVVKPFPLQFNAHQRAQAIADTDLRAFTCDEPTAFEKLRKYWTRLGFRQIPETGHLALSPTLVTPTIRDLDGR